MSDKLRELAERWNRQAEGMTMSSLVGNTKTRCADELLQILDAESDAGVLTGEVIGSLNIQRFRGCDSMVNHDFDYYGNLPDGNYKLYTHPQPVRSGVVSDDARERFESAMRKTWSDFNSSRHPHRPDEYLKASEQCAWQGYQAHVKEALSEPSPIYECKHCKLPNHAGMDHADCEDAANSRAMIAAIKGQPND